MYIPKFNEETRVPVIHQLMRSHPLASLVTFGASGLFASHLPMVLDERAAPFGMLRCHVSRANAQWKDFDPDVQALAIFSGAEHYISPAWYAEKQATGKVVPTWNYVVVHAYGYLKVMDDVVWLRAHVESLTKIHEAGMQNPWAVSDAPEEYVAPMLKGIVGLEMKIERLEGKWKLSQNRSEEDRRGVVEGLEDGGEMKRLMLDALEDRG
ncbi:FMN-binding negative transcriptional regulator [Acidobacterium sp. S8]|uniref:FMN-binding negative transcriptional regulator n=1 Tax=Acidobacterium sp. S8 TaxID=1641854 RepID=UPI00131A60C0|nr:FMN-binding negative transcriptional regulator [Acidobacterium sp. S8]